MDKKEKFSQGELQDPFHVQDPKQLEEDSGSPSKKRR
jgi:hypothetical protein